MLKKITACVLSMSMILQSVVYTGFAQPTAKSVQYAEHTDFLFWEAEKFGLKQDEKLTDNGDGTYTLDLTLSSKLSVTDSNPQSEQPKSGHFTITRTGDYVVELWGGDGGDAGDQIFNQKTGLGGKGGYIYGVIHLEAGQTLYYTLGGKGGQSTEVDQGGGANGDGGGHGQLGLFTIGGGGGGSAQILDFTGNEKQANGGAGGSITSLSGELSQGHSVQGTYFAGQDGFSNFGGSDHTGKGGTNVPGELPKGTLSFIDPIGMDKPNDWLGVANPETEGGSGGSVNWRGGAGGAGYCGGSGGTKPLVSIYENEIGAGGGGSSFISNKVQYKSLSDSANALLTANGTNPNQSKGGTIKFTYIEDTTEQNHTISLSGKVSPYFNIVGDAVEPSDAVVNVGTDSKTFTVNNADGTSIEATSSVTDNLVTVTGINPTITTTETTVTEGDAAHTRHDGNAEFTVSIAFTPKEGFLGGNDVPVLDYTNTAVSTGMSLSQTYEGTAAEVQITKQNENSPNESNKSDYAMVKINNRAIDKATLSDALTAHDKTYVKGNPGISHSELYTLAEGIFNYTGENSWKADFVDFLPGANTTIYTPESDITIDITAGIIPKVKDPVKSSVGEKAVEYGVTKQAHINVRYQITFDLSEDITPDLTMEGEYYLVPENLTGAFEIPLQLTGTNSMPETITVTVDGTALAKGTYNYNIGDGGATVVIPQDIITGNIHITAHSIKPATRHIYFIYSETPGGVMKIISQEVMAGESLAGLPLEKDKITITPPAGYEFKWEWQVEGGVMPETMPSNADLYCMGEFTPKNLHP